MHPMISIIVPVYNVGDFIGECLDSICNLSYVDIEVIFVDDCGNDNSVSIIRDYAENHSLPRYRIIRHDRNKGLSAARNTGLRAAEGEYVYFLDSDDYVSRDCIEKLVAPLERNLYDFVIGNYSVVGGQNMYPETQVGEGEILGRDIVTSYSKGKWYMMAWNKLCRRQFLVENGLWFEEGLLHEDVVWSFKLACVANSMYVVTDSTYYYRVRANSIMNATSLRKDARHYARVFECISEFVCSKDMQMDPALYSLFEGRRSTLLFSILARKEKELYSECYSLLRDSVYITPQSAFAKGVIDWKYLLRDLHYSLPLALGKFYKKMFYLIVYRLRGREIEGALL